MKVKDFLITAVMTAVVATISVILFLYVLGIDVI